ncbi:UDP-N-acetylglucosamine 1-carboxyvinyltransferase [Candidatus Curtissbacteria bacterium RIFCSPHIGHO2_01_FULL_41_11]|uniref:UDP-N-acetylglucosamine 1-carboxyvinyltransferase n=1 Tax=Candidatus Curtissbacteria bacterium RIFCSPHIGHO2_01_FULL_41_11 TaxID=1797711 RepID=A0A1F5G4U6_9BACT|nr:MAG: UDP-N-acetylglucosamine 1-carboxyvinyltransferase [Candidatus Curtissbacteria bacterium RIFCSPHIGHO2_01_FULL_41_11]
MARFEITGGKTLSGKIKVAGNKNSVLPIMAACLLTEETCTLENVPVISDVHVMAKLLEIVGAKTTQNSSRLTITCQKITTEEFPSQLTEKLRAAVLLLAPMLARTGHVKMGYPGGDVIGRRPLETHTQVLESLGAKVEQENDFYIAEAKSLKGADIFLQEASVTATENAILAGVTAEGTTTIKRAASEPHIIDLCHFLIKMGAKISGTGSNYLKIEGVKHLSGTSHNIRTDHIEVGTFAILAGVTGSKLEINPIIKEDLDMILLTLEKFGVNVKVEGETLIVNAGKLKAVEKVVTDVWPGFPTDLMAPTIVLATQAEGMTLLHDWMYESRMFFVDKLLSMGAKVEIADPHRVLVYGPTKLHGQRLDTPDIRAGIALVIAALAAKGASQIERAELIERGYENIVERLSQLGAKIKRSA